MEKTRDNPSLELGKIESKKEVFLEAQKTTRKSTLPHGWTCVTSKIAELEPKLQMYKGRVVLRRDIAKRRLRAR